MNPQPKPRAVIASNIPNELRDRPQWVCWKAEWNEDKQKWNKPPLNPKNGMKASKTNPEHWASFEQAMAYYENHKQNGCGGIGFVFTEQDPYGGVDLDNCRNPETGEIAEWAIKVIEKINSYSEVSPSNTGVKIFVRGRVKAGRRKGNIEVYSQGAYFTVTGGKIGATEW